MKRVLQLEIESGVETCASEPGDFCKYLRTRKFGSITYCEIWHDINCRGQPSPIDDKDGWLQRREECMKAELIEDKTNSSI